MATKNERRHRDKFRLVPHIIFLWLNLTNNVGIMLFRIVKSVGEVVTHLKPGDHALPVFT